MQASSRLAFIIVITLLTGMSHMQSHGAGRMLLSVEDAKELLCE